MRVLVTNDDGIESEGIHVLAAYLEKAGHDVLVAAPDGDMSGTGAAIGVLRPGAGIDVRRVDVPGCASEAWAVASSPSQVSADGASTDDR